MRHIVRVDGWTGLFRGVVPHATYAALLQFSTDLMRKPVDKFVRGSMDIVSSHDADVPDNEDGVHTLGHAVRRCFRSFCVSSILGVVSCTMFHPLKVIAVRAMVQFDGRETVYSNIIGAFKEIYNNEGFYGFFAGLVPPFDFSNWRFFSLKCFPHVVRTDNVLLGTRNHSRVLHSNQAILQHLLPVI